MKQRVSEVVLRAEKKALDVLTAASFDEKKTFVSNLIKLVESLRIYTAFHKRLRFLLLNDKFSQWEDEIGRA